MEFAEIYARICADLRSSFVREHLERSSLWFGIAILAWCVSQLVNDTAHWEGVLQAVAVLYINVVGLYALFVALTAVPLMRVAAALGLQTERPERLASHAAGRFRHVSDLGMIAVGVLIAQLAVGLQLVESLRWPDWLLLGWILVALCVLVQFNMIMWLAARALDMRDGESPLLNYVQNSNLLIYWLGWAACSGVLISVIVVTGL